MDEPELLSPSQAGRILGISRTKTYQLIAARAIPVVTFGRSVRVPRRALLDWIRERTVVAADARLPERPGSANGASHQPPHQMDR